MTPTEQNNIMAGADNHPSGGYRESTPEEIAKRDASPFAAMLDSIKAAESRFDGEVASCVHYLRSEEAERGELYSVEELTHKLATTDATADDGTPSTMYAALQQLLAEAKTRAKVKPAKEPKAKKEKVVAAPLTPDGFTVWTDAGTKPNPGYGGWGIHGYLYNDALPKKGTGNPLIHLTAQGYVLKSDAAAQETKPLEVTPLKYIDGVGSIPHCSNNGGEVVAMGQGLEYAARFDLKRVNLYTDSQYAIQNLAHVPHWERNDWVKRDGTMVKNIPHWKATRAAYDLLVSKNVDVSIQWVKGHADNVGNITADRYATMGREASAAGDACSMIESSEPEGYWAGEERHPFIYHKHTYFTSNPAFNVAGEYYLGDHGKEPKDSDGTWMLGKRNADATYAYVRLKTPDELIEIVRRNLLSKADRSDALVVVSLDQVFTAGCSRDLKRFNEHALRRPSRTKLDMNYHDNEPVLIELNPPRLAVRAIEAVNHLKALLTDYLDNPDSVLVKTDLTERLFKTDDKGKVTLTDELGAGVTIVKLSASYAKAENGVQGTTDVSLVLGVDLPERNALKRLEKSHPKVTLVTWREAASVRFATVVECDEGIGIWAGYYANTKYLKPEA